MYIVRQIQFLLQLFGNGFADCVCIPEESRQVDDLASNSTTAGLPFLSWYSIFLGVVLKRDHRETKAFLGVFQEKTHPPGGNGMAVCICGLGILIPGFRRGYIRLKNGVGGLKIGARNGLPR